MLKSKIINRRQIGNGLKVIEVFGYCVEEVSALRTPIPMTAYSRADGMSNVDCLACQTPSYYRTAFCRKLRLLSPTGTFFLRRPDGRTFFPVTQPSLGWRCSPCLTCCLSYGAMLEKCLIALICFMCLDTLGHALAHPGLQM